MLLIAKIYDDGELIAEHELPFVRQYEPGEPEWVPDYDVLLYLYPNRIEHITVEADVPVMA